MAGSGKPDISQPGQHFRSRPDTNVVGRQRKSTTQSAGSQTVRLTVGAASGARFANVVWQLSGHRGTGGPL
jgi:hypothetical protein